uniref:Uncharacterized protein n=1 Tax=Aquila chrysaetos chrysaetos TaxID=223781 RepID=A0A663F4Y7_AQUCH
MFIDSWVVGVNVYGSNPSKLIVSRRVISDTKIRAHLCPPLFRGSISCFVTRWMNHSWSAERRLVIHRLVGEGSNKVGNSIEIRISGMPKRQGLVNWSKKFRIMSWGWVKLWHIIKEGRMGLFL